MRSAYLDWASRHSSRTVVIPVDGQSVESIFDIIKDEIIKRSNQ